MSSVGSNSSSFRQSLSIFEKRQSDRSLKQSFAKSFSMCEDRRQSLGSTGSFEVPPAFRTSLNIFEYGEEINPLVPSFFRDHEGNIVQKPGSSNDLKKEFVFSLRQAKLQEVGPTYSVSLIIDFQSRIRGYLGRKVHKKRAKSIVRLQALGRGFLQRQRFHVIRQASIRCQSIMRRYIVQRETRRLYDIRNPPRIRKLRNQIAAIQLKLDVINEEQKRMDEAREQRKAQIRKECLERFAKMERDKALGIANVQKSGSQLISYFQKENNALRATMRELASNIADLRSENKLLERDNQVVAQYTQELHTHYKKMKETNGSLQNQVDKLREHYKPKWEDAITERETRVINETRQKYIYRQGLFRIVDFILLDQSCDSDFKDDIARVVGCCEKEFDCELDIDTPLELYPAPPEQKLIFSSFEPDNVKSVSETEEDEPFEFIDDADFLLPGLMSINPSKDSDGRSLDGSSSTSSSPSSTSASDSTSSTHSSDDNSAMSDQSFRRKTSSDHHSSKDVERHFEESDAIPLSPIKKDCNESSSTVCSTNESEYEVQSVACSQTEDYPTVKIVADDEVESDSNSGTVSSMPPWDTSDGNEDVPAIINIPSLKELKGKEVDPGETLTFASTASTAAIESESSSSYVDVDIIYSRSASLEQLKDAPEPADNEEVCVSLSSLQRNEPSSALHRDGGGSFDPDASAEHGNMPNEQAQPNFLEASAKKQQELRERTVATSMLQRDTPKSSTKPVNANTDTNPKPFRARPAPKFGAPKIPVRDRNPGKLRSSRAVSPKKQ